MKNLGQLCSVSLLLGFALVGCGRNETLGSQEGQRSEVGPELQGTWKTPCESRQTHSLDFQADRLTVERVDYFDPECQEKQRTTRHSGKYQLAHTFKQGVANSIIFTADNELKVSLHADQEVDDQNNVLARISNQKEQEVTASLSTKDKKNVTRENHKIREAKKVAQWKRDEEKTLSRFQVEKLNAEGLNAQAVAPLDTRVGLRYEVDNGYLQISAGGDFAHVFSKP